jgi:predicted S18 family serine protease
LDLVFTLALLATLVVHTDTARAPRGLAVDTSRFVHVSETPGRGRLLMTAVTGPSLSFPTGATSVEAMDASLRAAVQAAASCAGERRLPPGLALRSRGFGGASAGLMFALTVLDDLRGGSLSVGRVLAGTGTISPVGEVGPVLAVAVKARAAESAGAGVFFAPVAQASEARSAAPHMLVVGVESLSGAVRFLGGRCTG